MECNIQNQPHYNLTYQLELLYFSLYDGELLWDIIPEHRAVYCVFTPIRWIITQTTATEEVFLMINLIFCSI